MGLFSRKPRTLEQALADRERVQSRYVAARSRLSKLPTSMWRKYSPEEIAEQRELTEGLKVKVEILDDEIAELRAKGADR